MLLSKERIACKPPRLPTPPPPAPPHHPSTQSLLQASVINALACIIDVWHYDNGSKSTWVGGGVGRGVAGGCGGGRLLQTLHDWMSAHLEMTREIRLLSLLKPPVESRSADTASVFLSSVLLSQGLTVSPQLTFNHRNIRASTVAGGPRTQDIIP